MGKGKKRWGDWRNGDIGSSFDEFLVSRSRISGVQFWGCIVLGFVVMGAAAMALVIFIDDVFKEIISKNGKIDPVAAIVAIALLVPMLAFAFLGSLFLMRA